MELCRTSLFICFKSMKWRRFSSKHSLERALNSLQSNWLFQPKFSISRDSALANILRICSDITHDSQYFRNVDFSCPTAHSVTPRENMVSFEFSCFKKFLSHLNLGGWHVGPTRPGKVVGGWGLAFGGCRREAHLWASLGRNGEHAGLRLDGGHNVNLDLRGSSITGFYLELKILTQNLKLVTCSWLMNHSPVISQRTASLCRQSSVWTRTGRWR